MPQQDMEGAYGVNASGYGINAGMNVPMKTSHRTSEKETYIFAAIALIVIAIIAYFAYRFVNNAEKAGDKIAGAPGDIAKAIGDALNNAVSTVTNTFDDGVKTITDAADNAVADAEKKVSDVVNIPVTIANDGIKAAQTGFNDFIAGLMGGATTGANNIMKPIVAPIDAAVIAAPLGVKAIGTLIPSAVTNAQTYNAVIQIIDKAGDTVQTAPSNVITTIKDLPFIKGNTILNNLIKW